MQQNYALQINKLINLLMKRGKRNQAQTVLFKALFYIRNKTLKNPLYILKKAFANSVPVVTFVPTKRGSKYYNVPSPIKQSRAVFLAASWIISAARTRSSSSSKFKHEFAFKLGDEIIDNAKGIGEAVRKKEAVYSIVSENRSYIRR